MEGTARSAPKLLLPGAGATTGRAEAMRTARTLSDEPESMARPCIAGFEIRALTCGLPLFAVAHRRELESRAELSPSPDAVAILWRTEADALRAAAASPDGHGAGTQVVRFKVFADGARVVYAKGAGDALSRIAVATLGGVARAGRGTQGASAAGYKLPGPPPEDTRSPQHCDPLLVVPVAVCKGLRSPRSWLTLQRLATMDCWGAYAPLDMPPPGQAWAFERPMAGTRQAKTRGADATHTALPRPAANPGRPAPPRSRRHRPPPGPAGTSATASATARSAAAAEAPEVAGGPAMARPLRFVSRGNAVLLAGAGRFVRVHRIAPAASCRPSHLLCRVLVYPVMLQPMAGEGTAVAAPGTPPQRLPDSLRSLWPTRSSDADALCAGGASLAEPLARCSAAPSQGPGCPVAHRADSSSATDLANGTGARPSVLSAPQGLDGAPALPSPAATRTDSAGLSAVKPVLLCPRVVLEQLSSLPLVPAVWAALSRRMPQVHRACGSAPQDPASATSARPPVGLAGPSAPGAPLHCRLYFGGEALCAAAAAPVAAAQRPDAGLAKDAATQSRSCGRYHNAVVFAVFARCEAPS